MKTVLSRAVTLIERHGVIVFVVAWALYALVASLWTHALPSVFHLDLRVFRAGAEAFLAGHSLYDAPLPVGGGREMPFTYPPIAAVLFVPLTWVDLEVAGTLWTLLSCAALAIVLTVVVRATGRDRSSSVWIGLVGLGLSTALIPVWITLNLGQIGILLMLLVVLDLLSQRPRWPRGALVGIAAAIKLTPAGFILLPLLRRDWRTAVWMAAVAVGLTVVGAIIAWDDSVAYWTTLGSASERVRVFEAVANHSFAGLADRLPAGATEMLAWTVLVVIAIGLGILAMRRQLSTGDVATALMVNAVVILLVSPVSWDHHWVWIAPIALLLALASVREPLRFGPLFVVTILVFVFEPGVPGSWLRWVAWGLMYVVLLIGVRPDPRPAAVGGSAAHRDRPVGETYS